MTEHEYLIPINTHLPHKNIEVSKGKQVKIASFTVPMDAHEDDSVGIAHHIVNILEDFDTDYLIQESYGGLFAWISSSATNHMRYEKLVEVELYLFLPESVYMYCSLKYGDTLHDLNR